MLKFVLKISDNKKGSCKVTLENPKQVDYDKAKDTEKTCGIMLQQKIMKALKELENE